MNIHLAEAEWCEDAKYQWLHYNIGSNSTFCHLCMTVADYFLRHIG